LKLLASAVGVAVNNPKELDNAFKPARTPAEEEEDSGPPFIPGENGKVEFDGDTWDDLPVTDG
jgi:hypothetical protein